jgi:hypothetical protein
MRLASLSDADQYHHHFLLQISKKKANDWTHFLRVSGVSKASTQAESPAEPAVQ